MGKRDEMQEEHENGLKKSRLWHSTRIAEWECVSLWNKDYANKKLKTAEIWIWNLFLREIQ